jgi:hypothetical protein
MRLAQVMQHFPNIDAENEYFDRGNFFNYLYSNALRNQIQSVTSCGTNALWYNPPLPCLFLRNLTQFQVDAQLFLW